MNLFFSRMLAVLGGIVTFWGYYALLHSPFSMRAFEPFLLWLLDLPSIRAFIGENPDIHFSTLSAVTSALHATVVSLIFACAFWVLLKLRPVLNKLSDYFVLGALLGGMFYIAIAMLGYRLALITDPIGRYSDYSYGTLISVLTWTLPYVLTLLFASSMARKTLINTDTIASRQAKPSQAKPSQA
ncbi:hypothetical protein [Enterovibrio coralii]|uniref:Uncharacterized protein n=1 Tax=Enterovibrio coralii TaxID=294935 RepID=A0A135I5Q5_9GAMM|nr:hypothetical protein [Enterovibrio coralii]KXF80773.1 hypothetical protein ATN88_15950 [Enterovibrio coralii]